MDCASTFFSVAPERITARDEARFFNLLKTGNNTFKKTQRSRLAAIDEALVARLAASDSRIGETLDLGISSGITTLELLERMKAAGHPIRMTGTDRSVRARIVALPFGCRALVEPDGHVLQYEVLGQAVRPWERRLDRWTGMRYIRRLIDGWLRKRAVRDALSGLGDEVALISPRLRHVEAFHWLEDDIVRRSPALIGRFDLVRAANLLNRHYFAPDDLRKAVANAISYMNGPGAWLLILRTHGAADHHGTLFRMSDAGYLTVVERYGSGSEVEDLVMELAG